MTLQKQIEEQADAILGNRVAMKNVRQTIVAYLQFKHDMPIDQRCEDCKNLLAVERILDFWLIRCKCGSANVSFRGAKDVLSKPAT
jgi:hypothetical protein